MPILRTSPRKKGEGGSELGKQMLEVKSVLCLWGAGLCTGGVLGEWVFLVCFQSAFFLGNADPIPGQGSRGRAVSPRELQPEEDSLLRRF